MLAYKSEQSIYYVVLAGGRGERLWPLSRVQNPKQFLTITGNETLLEQTLVRIRSLMTPYDYLWITTVTDHADMIEKMVGNTIDRLIKEPVARNTAPAVIYTLLHIAQCDPDASVFFFPADAFIPPSDYDHFVETLTAVIHAVSCDDIIALIGIKPTCNATEYGYIECDWSNRTRSLYKVVRFHEKPNAHTARAYCKNPAMFWNSGIFGGRVSCFLDECAEHVPEIYKAVSDFYNKIGSYDAIPSVSIDYALMEKSGRMALMPASFAWSDVGTLSIFLDLKKKEYSDKKHRNNAFVTIDAHNNLVESLTDKLIVLIGVHDLCIIEMNDALIVTRREDVERIRSVMMQVREQSELQRYL